jgi:hypothetical protein
MKLSNKLLLFTIIGLGALLLIVMFITRFYLSSDLDFEKFGKIETKEYQTDDFNGISSGGFTTWDISLKRNDSHYVRIEAGEQILKRVKVEVSNGILKLGLRPTKNIVLSTIKAEIGLPFLSEFGSDGNVTLKLQNFEMDDLIINSNGMAKVKGVHNRIKNLSVEHSGFIVLRFADSLIDNANLKIDGTGVISLNIDNGSLTGELAGLIWLSHYGHVMKKAINTDGLVFIKKKKRRK